jgi:hypothetical protein
MKSLTKRLVIGGFGIAIISLTLYIWTLLFMIEGQPANHDRPDLFMYAWICLAAVPLELLGILFLISRIK